MSLNKKHLPESISSKHLIAEYITIRLEELSWKIGDLCHHSKISQGEISKILSGSRKGLKAKNLYNIYKAFGDSCETARQIVYPNLDLNLKEYHVRDRNSFGKLMHNYEQVKNSIEEISVRTGISENRISNLYYRNAAIEGFELILIEKAIGMEPGELFDIYFSQANT